MITEEVPSVAAKSFKYKKRYLNIIKVQVMEGIMYLTDEHNKKKYVQIDLEKYGEMWSEFDDVLIAESRKDDEKIPLEEVKRMLKSNEL